MEFCDPKINRALKTKDLTPCYEGNGITITKGESYAYNFAAQCRLAAIATGFLSVPLISVAQAEKMDQKCRIWIQ